MLDRGLNAPITTSAGRLFDAVAAMVVDATVSTFEGQAAMALEHAADQQAHLPYPITVDDTATTLVVDWRPTIAAILADVASGADAGHISGRFHAAMTEAIVAVAVRVGHDTVALSGGCFQNRMLTEMTARRLREEGFAVLLHRRVPPNDGGISLGQAVIAAAALGHHEPPGSGARAID
jgi:hydrogenase maturation protein HypF